jgi:hypothetical protein
VYRLTGCSCISIRAGVEVQRMLTLRRVAHLRALLWIFVRTFRVRVLGRVRAALSGCCCPRGHLKIANLAVRESAIGIRVPLLRLLLLRLLVVLRWLRFRVGHAGRIAVLLAQVNSGGRRRDLALILEEARLEVDDIVAELVVLCLKRLKQLRELLVLLDLVLERLDVLLLALTEGALGKSVWLQTDATNTYLSGAVLRSALGG